MSIKYGLLATATIVSGKENYIRVPIGGPTSLHIAWDAVVDFGDSHAIYSSAQPDPDVPAFDAPITAYLDRWSLEPISFTGAAAALGCKVLHLGNWRAPWLLLAIAAPTAGGVIEIYGAEVGDNVR